MMQDRVRTFVRGVGCLFAATIAIGAFGANAQTFPERTVEIVVGYQPGGLTDGLARVIAQELTQSLGWTVIVQNRPGAGGTIAAGTVAQAKPDGYTLLLADHAFMTYPSLYPSFAYDTFKAFKPVSVIGAASMVFLVPPDSPVKSLKELVAVAKAKPESITFASGGTGTVTHLAGELLEKVAEVDFLHIPYRGVSPGITDLLGGRVSMMVSSIGPVVPLIKSGKVRALAISGPSPMDVLPGVPTVAAAGYPAATAVGYWGFLAPANLPTPVLDQLSKALMDVIKRPKTRETLLTMGVDPVGSAPAEYATIVRDETTKWTEVIKRIGLQLK